MEIQDEDLRWVRMLALRVARGKPGYVDVDDLVSAGCIGLLEARDAYQPERGATFKTFAAFRVRGAMLDHLRSTAWTPRHVRARQRQIGKAARDLAQQIGRRPTREEIADACGMRFEELEAALALPGEPVEMPVDEDGGTWEPGDSAALDALQALSTHRDRAAVMEAVERLPAAEKLVVSLTFWGDMVLADIALLLGVTESRACQIFDSAIRRLARWLA